MNKWTYLKYYTILTGPIFAYMALTWHGLWTYLLPIYVFVLIPVLELFFKGTTENMTEAEEEIAKEDRLYDWLLYSLVPIQYGILLYFCFSISEVGLTTFELVGRIWSMGVVCTTLGINVGHELGHRGKKYEQNLSKALLLSTLYMHFFIEHNRGHHKRVATEDDPATSRYGQTVYGFWFRSVTLGYLSAWKIEAKRLKKRNLSVFSLHNQMLRFQLIQIAFVGSIYFFFGGFVTLCFVGAATIGFSYLEVVNYIEHYGLKRKKIGENRYEKVLPVHAWNSNHPLGRIMLFEVTRHSDHHFRASRKYQLLRHFDKTPYLPFGYPTMILIALCPPLWFYIMHKQIAKFRANYPKEALDLAA
ncbi:MAG: alkane 1-monooxygenase [Chitinophagales bacterium]